MRFSSPAVSGSSPAPPSRCRKHRRRLSPTRSTTSHDPRDPSSPSYSRPSSGSSAAADDEVEDDTASVSDYGTSSYSGSRSSYPSDPVYVNVAPLPIFRGEASECPVAHLARFDRVCRANNATAADTLVRIFPVTLDGDAALWYDLTIEPSRPALPWVDIRAAFLRAFTRLDFADRTRAELMSLKQRDGEGVNAYHLRLQWILRKWPEHGFPDALLKGIFVDGLKEDYQDWVLPQRPATLADAVMVAMSWEQARSVREARKAQDGRSSGGGGGCCRVAEAKCGFCDGEHEEEGCEVRRRMRELLLRSKDGAAPTPAMSVARREGGNQEGEGGLMRTASMRKGGGQCQCSRHQCWKKLERSSSTNGVAAVDGNPAAE